MYDLDLVKINKSLVKSINLCAAARRMLGCNGEGYEDVGGIEREIREAAAECQRVLKSIEKGGERATIDG